MTAYFFNGLSTSKRARLATFGLTVQDRTTDNAEPRIYSVTVTGNKEREAVLADLAMELGGQVLWWDGPPI